MNIIAIVNFGARMRSAIWRTAAHEQVLYNHLSEADSRGDVATGKCLNQKAAGRGENAVFENRSVSLDKRRICHLQPGTATLGSGTKTVPLTAIWQVNPQNGRVECRWTRDPDDIAAHQALPVLERFSAI